MPLKLVRPRAVPQRLIARGAADVRGYVAPTDLAWFDFLSSQPGVDEVNFWRPSGAGFKALQVGEPFFFKLKAPRHAIGGFGLYARTDRLPLWLAWETFGLANGVPDQETLLRRVNANRAAPGRLTSEIGCISLVGSRFFSPDDYVEVPRDWSSPIVAGKGYDMSRGEGLRLWQQCLERAPGMDMEFEMARYGTPRLVAPRLGQGSFRLAVYEAYDRACAVTGEHSLPVLEAAHIKPYSIGGAHEVRNGLPLRRDLHRLFDLGYVTFRADLSFMVSDALRLEYDNGRHYYEMDGRPLRVPGRDDQQPDAGHLAWHRESVFRAG